MQHCCSLNIILLLLVIMAFFNSLTKSGLAYFGS